MSSALHLAVRTVHLLGMVALVGGSALVWATVRRSAPVRIDRLRRYELGFWVLLALMLATGVGNLGAVGAPGPGTAWGTVLTGKLLVVLALVLGSFLRTLLVLRWPSGAEPDGTGSALERAYGATAGTLLLLVVLAEVLAHG